VIEDWAKKDRVHGADSFQTKMVPAAVTALIQPTESKAHVKRRRIEKRREWMMSYLLLRHGP
jgi:hypothetical protein